MLWVLFIFRKSISNTFGGFYGQLEQESSIGSGESYGQNRQLTDDELSGKLTYLFNKTRKCNFKILKNVTKIKWIIFYHT